VNTRGVAGSGKLREQVSLQATRSRVRCSAAGSRSQGLASEPNYVSSQYARPASGSTSPTPLHVPLTSVTRLRARTRRTSRAQGAPAPEGRARLSGGAHARPGDRHRASRRCFRPSGGTSEPGCDLRLRRIPAARGPSAYVDSVQRAGLRPLRLASATSRRRASGSIGVHVPTDPGSIPHGCVSGRL
jgi:hypothetical protein